MVFENPPWAAAEDTTTMMWTTTEYEWTRTGTEEDYVPGTNMTVKYASAPRIVTHEFGHTLGLPDFYDNNAPIMRLIDRIMNTGFAITFDGVAHDFCETVEKGHGRIERRRCWAISEPDHLDYLNDGNRWKNLTSIGMVESERSVDGKTSVESRYYISSLPGDAEQMLAATRGHWSIENSLHWVLDISFREDDSRVREGSAAENLAVIRHMALNLLKQDRTIKAWIKGKRKKAGWDNDYLLAVISQ